MQRCMNVFCNKYCRKNKVMSAKGSREAELERSEVAAEVDPLNNIGLEILYTQ